MPTAGTRPRAIRVPLDLWNQARDKARSQGTTLTAVIVAALRDYVSPDNEENR
jgi:hypothetical protein